MAAVMRRMADYAVPGNGCRDHMFWRLSPPAE
jgi:hypothetical protein